MDIGEWKKHAKRILSGAPPGDRIWDEVTTALLYASENDGLPLLDAAVAVQEEMKEHVRAEMRQREEAAVKRLERARIQHEQDAGSSQREEAVTKRLQRARIQHEQDHA